MIFIVARQGASRPGSTSNSSVNGGVDNDSTAVYKECNNSIAMTPNPRVALGGGGPNSDRKVRGVNRSEGSVGHSSFGPNPTANLAGEKKEGTPGQVIRSWVSVVGTGSGGVEWSATVRLNPCGLLGMCSGAASGSKGR